MKSAKNSPSDTRALIVLSFFVALWLAAMLTGCTTVTPRIVEAPKPSWDGTNQNSGFVGWSGPNGVITPHARERYNGLIEIYGKKFIPPLVHDYGITIKTNQIDSSLIIEITPEALADFALMNRWHKVDAVKP